MIYIGLLLAFGGTLVLLAQFQKPENKYFFFIYPLMVGVIFMIVGALFQCARAESDLGFSGSDMPWHEEQESFEAAGDGTGFWGFEEYRVGEKIDVKRTLTCVRKPNCPVVSDEVAKTGKHSAKVVSDFKASSVRPVKCCKRTIHNEMRVNGGARQREERWYKWSIFIPNTHQWFSSHWHVIGQTHNAKYHPWVLFLRGDRWIFQNSVTHKLHFMGPAKRGVWQDFLIHQRWSTGNDGILEGWVDGKLMFAFRGKTNQVDPMPPFFKLGSYRNGPEGQRVILFFDDLSVSRTKP